MKLFDTHCHIADPAFDPDRAEVINRFRAAGVARALVAADPREEEPNQDRVFGLIEQYDFLYAAIGVHPHNASRWEEGDADLLRRYLAHPRCPLLGEIGLDYHYDLSPRDVQRRVFERQLELAHALQKPVQLHIREAHGDCMDILRARKGRLPGGIMHCYTGSWEAAKVYLDLGFYISLSGAVTFKNAPKLVEVAKNTPADRLLIETDCPYMAPVPLRGRRNEPSYIVHTFQKVAELRGDDPGALALRLWENAHRAMNLPVEMRTVYLAGGCFWGVQKFFDQFDGVLRTEVGYANGPDAAPTYQDVCQNSGHAETVRIDYDAAAISLTELLKYYFMVIDPLSVNRQGHDAGIQYRTGIYYTDGGQLPEIEAVCRAESEKVGAPLAVEVGPLQNFFTAEEYHQKYLDKNPDGYCHIPRAMLTLSGH